MSFCNMIVDITISCIIIIIIIIIIIGYLVLTRDYSHLILSKLG